MTNTERNFAMYLDEHGYTPYGALCYMRDCGVDILNEVSNYWSNDELVSFLTYSFGECWDLDLDGQTFAEWLSGDSDD